MKIFLIIATISMMAACNLVGKHYEQCFDISDKGWNAKDSIVFSVDIPDSLTRYNTQIFVRHRDVYQWQNMYVKLTIKYPNGKVEAKQINLPLCDDGGAWYGKCVGDLCYIPISISENKRFLYSGKYTYIIEPDMRVYPVKDVISIGLSVEKSSENKK
jgi:gliding motility-associated lipoprotein GldH